jgi:hypothetical protein
MRNQRNPERPLLEARTPTAIENKNQNKKISIATPNNLTTISIIDITAVIELL